MHVDSNPRGGFPARKVPRKTLVGFATVFRGYDTLGTDADTVEVY